MAEIETLYKNGEEFQAAFEQHRESRLQSADFDLPRKGGQAVWLTAPKFYDWGAAATHFFGEESPSIQGGTIKRLPSYQKGAHENPTFTGWVADYKVFGDRPAEINEKADFAFILDGKVIFTQNNKYEPFTLRPPQITDYPPRLFVYRYPDINLHVAERYEDIGTSLKRDLILTSRSRFPNK